MNHTADVASTSLLNGSNTLLPHCQHYFSRAFFSLSSPPVWKMQENFSNFKDPTIKLFGMKIPLSAESEPPPVTGPEVRPVNAAQEEEEKAENKDFSAAEATEITEEEEEKGEEDDKTQATKEPEDSETSTESNVKPNTPPVSEESTKSKTSKPEKEEKGEENTQEKTLKKPDKILPCPRCNSMDTKFCYYNNYNINQPRHFCKACQRYWTAGGTMRNVPVGAGRRKNKNSASHYRHITISEALQAAHIDPPNGTHNPGLKTNGRVLSFGVDSPICNSMASVFNLGDKKPRNGYHQLKESRVNHVSNGDDCSSGSSVTVSNEDRGRNCSNNGNMQGINGFISPIPCLPGVPWPYQLPPPPPTFCPPGFPLQFYPPVWNCGAWNMPMLSPQASTNQKPPTLGKHSRNGETVKPYEPEKPEPEKPKNGSVLVPKILRIDDPNEAAKSSIWTTLGIKNELLNREKLFKAAFESKTKEKAPTTEASPVLMANPAALSRSMNFRESS